MGIRGGWLQGAVCLGALYQRSYFFTPVANLASYQKRSIIQDYVTYDRRTIFTQKCDPNCTPHTHQTDIFLTQKNNTAVYIKIFYKCYFGGRIAEWKQYTDRSDVTACVSGSLVLSGFDSVVLGNWVIFCWGKIRVRISDLILNSSVFDKGPFYIWFQTIGYKEKSWNVCPEMMISSSIGHAHLSTAAYSMLMPGLWGCYMSLTFSGLSTQAAFLNVLAHFLCSSVGDDKEVKISCLIFWSKWVFFILRWNFPLIVN